MEVHCWQCNKRLPIDGLKGEAVIICTKCKARNPLPRPVKV